MKLKSYIQFVNESKLDNISIEDFKDFLKSIIRDNYKISSVYHWAMQWGGEKIKDIDNIDMFDMINFVLAGGSKLQSFLNDLNDIRSNQLKSWMNISESI